MKRFKFFYSLLLIIAAILFSSFNNQKKNINSNTLPVGNFTAIQNDSVPVSWNNFYFHKEEGIDVITIFALTGGNISLQISINANTVGTYEVNGRTCSATYYVSESDQRNGIEGSVNITSIENNMVSGTFSFTDGIMENGIAFSNGVFSNVPLQ